MTIWDDAHVEVRLPCEDLERARAWYRDTLGLEAAEGRPGGLRYVLGSTEFALYASSGSSSGSFTQAGFYVRDLDAAVAELRGRGVVFEEIDVPGLQTRDGVADIAGNYPSKGTGERAAWFKDSEGNLLGLGQTVGADDLQTARQEGHAAAQRGEEAAPGCTTTARGRAWLQGYVEGAKAR